MLTTTIIQAQIINEYKQENNSKFYKKITLTFSENDFIFKTLGEYDIVYLNEAGVLNEIGKPMLPIKNILVAIPENMKPTSVQIINLTQKDLQYSFNIIPAQKPQKTELFIKNTHYFKDQYFYQLDQYYPSKTLELSGVTDFAGQAIAIIRVCPLQYNPALKSLKLLINISFTIECEKGYTCGDYLPINFSEQEIKEYQQKIKNMVINPEDVMLKKSYNLKSRNLEPGNYDYVIITQSSWVSAFQMLLNWKTKKGIPATIVTTEWIYANYSGSTNKEKIKAFIQDANTNWGTIYFLLGGDIDVIPCHYRTFSSVDPESVPTDTYYADYDNDWMCEVNIGRASVTGPGNNAGGIENFINKILTYEKNPPATNYAKNISLFGFDLDAVTDGEDCKIDIDNLYIPSSWTVNSVYDSYSGDHENAVKQAVNNGQNLINHIDHSNYNVMGAGYFNHGWYLDTSEVDAFSNGNKQSILYSIGCWAEAFDYDNCIAEHFVRDTNGGGVGFVGNTRYGWYLQGFDDYLSLRYDRYFFRSLFNQNHYKLGDLFSDHKMDAYFSITQNDYNKYIFTELNLLGDPELPIWLNNPASFVVLHPNEIPIGPTSFTVHVETTTGSNIQNAYVCLWKANEVYLTGLTNSNGNITFNFSTSSPGIMNVTVTKQDYLPYEGYVITGNQPPVAPFNPNPSNGTTGVNINADLSWNCSDPDGDPLTYNVYFGTSSNPPLVSSNQSSTNYDPGTMNFNTTYYWKIVAFDSSSSTIGPIWSFTTEINDPPYTPSNPSPTNGATNVDINADISWTGGDPNGDTVNYDIYFGTSSPPPLIYQNYEYTTYDPGTMQYNTTYYWKIKAIDVHGFETIGPEWYFITEDEPSNYPPGFSNENPSDGSTNVPITISLLSIYIYDKEGDSFNWSIETSPFIGSSNGNNENNGTKSCTITGLNYNTTYTWFVNATDKGSGKKTTKTFTFTTVPFSNNPPNKPVIQGPIRGDKGVQYTFTFTSIDPDGDNIKYFINWGDSTITNWTSFYASGETYSEKHTWNTTGNFIIKAKAKDTSGVESDWATFEITIPRDKSINGLFLKLLNINPRILLLFKIIFKQIKIFFLNNFFHSLQ
ncbi:MAG: C25 family cysteine peptidase [Thermoplasmatota archaeon]